MAYIPDDAIEDAPSLSSPAWLLYCNLCRRRNHQTGRVFFSFQRTQQILGTSRASLYRALNELETKGWITRDGPGIIVPSYGNFEPVNRRFELSQKWDKPSHIGDTKSQKVRRTNKEVPALKKPDIFKPSVPSEEEANMEATEPIEEVSLSLCDRCEDQGMFDQYPDDQGYRPDRWIVCHCIAGDDYMANQLANYEKHGLPAPEFIRARAPVLES